MRTVSVNPATDPIWESLAMRKASSIFTSPAWIRVLADTYGWEPRGYVLLDEAGEPAAGVPYFHISDTLRSVTE